MKDFFKKKKLFYKILTISICFLFVFGLSKPLFAQPHGGTTGGRMTPPTAVTAINTQDEKSIFQGIVNTIKEMDQRYSKWAKDTAIGKSFNSAIMYIAKKMAYEAGTYLGSGGEGGTPFWRKEYFGDFINNVGDNAAGHFLETLGSKNGFAKFNLCEPDLNLKLGLGLGIMRAEEPSQGGPECTFTKMKDNWERELNKETFLNDVQDMFNPESNDLGISFRAHTGVLERKTEEKINRGMEDLINGRWSDTEGAAKEHANPPGYLEKVLGLGQDMFVGSLTNKDPEIISDVFFTFTNSLAYSAFDKWMRNLADDTPRSTSPYEWEGLDLSDPNSSGRDRNLEEEAHQKIVEADYEIPGDYDILAKLSSCPDSQNPGVDECVINDGFRQAISSQLTVKEAVERGVINGSQPFGFESKDREPNHKTGYPYRSMKILRKYRILPVGWEMAAQSIRDESRGTYSLKEMLACYESGNDDGLGDFHENWCTGLVDPNWVLKAPQNYCAREGYGENVANEKIIGEGQNSSLRIGRKEYCSDNQNCIQENADGSCEYYGYCTEDKRKWTFGKDAECESIYNTCQTFNSPESGKISYLKNTIDYSDCSSEYVGCEDYVSPEASFYDISEDKMDWSSGTDIVFFDRDAEECEEDEEGCHEFIRTAPGLGSNLIYDAGFEEGNNPLIGLGGISTAQSFEGVNSLNLNTGNNNTSVVVGPSDYSVSGGTYAFSFYAKDCSESDEFSIDGQSTTTKMRDSNSWGRYSTTYSFPKSVMDHDVTLNFDISSSDCLIDAVKLERAKFESDNKVTGYSAYRDNGLVYEKLLPDYMEDDCYVAGSNKFKDDAPEKCYEFARECDREEVGCEMYTEENGGFSIPAKVKAQDRCPAECVGFDTYVQDETHFSSARDQYFIPDTAENCSAENIGCDEFTNLDKVGQGGEAKEYYSYLRQCVDPGDTDANCATFYTWQGEAGGGEQLVSYTLNAVSAAGGTAPEVVVPHDSSVCNETIYNLPPHHPDYNSDCKEFYNQQGDVFYRLYSHTKTCSDNCHRYRRTENNIDPDLTSSADCSAGGSGYAGTADTQFHWDSTANECYYCKNGGEWSTQHNGCIYKGIPGEGKPCSADSNGCREYNGNHGNNTQIVLASGFESGAEGWSGGDTEDVSVRTDQKSFRINSGAADKTLGFSVNKGNAYKLEFLARGDGSDVQLSAYLTDTSSNAEFGEVTAQADEWSLFSLNLENLDHTATSGEKLVLEITGGGADVFVDDIILTEITDRYYLIENSWQTPDSCNRDIYGNPHSLYMLGCGSYSDSGGDTHYLHQFDSLCQESAVGCEVMIDTHNHKGREGFDSTTNPQITVDDDNFVYAVYDESKECRNMGCERFGRVSRYESEKIYEDVYLENNPNDYSSILCNMENEGCMEWDEEGGGKSYFKDPGEQVCEYREDSNGNKDWYRKKVKRCDVDSDEAVGSTDAYCKKSIDCPSISSFGECSKDSECGSNNVCVEGECHYSCITEDNDIQCPTEEDFGITPKTLGEGGVGGKVQQPEDGWAGLCPASQSGCTEYIDPESKFSIDLLSDRYAGDDVEVRIEPNTLYYDPDGSLPTSGDYYTSSDFSADNHGSLGDNLVYYGGNSSEIQSAPANNVLREAVVDYMFSQKLDKSGCGGAYEFDKGCILFNERSVNQGNYKELIYDVENTSEGDSPDVTSPAPQKDSNMLLKVQPDRECDEWLACRSYIEEDDGEDSCFDIGICDSLDETGNCSSFIDSSDGEQDHYPGNGINYSNMTGYSKVAYKDDTYFQKVPNDLYNPGSMEQDGQYSNVYNGSFELYGKYSKENEGDTFFPFGWSPNPIGGDDWSEERYSVIADPVNAQRAGIEYPVTGKAFLEYSAGDNSVSPYSEDVSVIPGKKYYLSFYINTENLGGGVSNDCRAFVDAKWSGGRETVEIRAGEGWQLKMVPLEPDSNSLNIHLGAFETGNLSGSYDADVTCSGQIYIDDIRIEPVLGVNSDWNKRQSCRLYPEEDSLSCDYTDTSGYQYRGQKGYCLDYDRSPGNEDACLLWWPVDEVKGNNMIYENAGYDGRYPVYNCTEVDMNFALVENRQESHKRETKDSFFGNLISFDWDDAFQQMVDNPVEALVTLSTGGLAANTGLLSSYSLNEASIDDIEGEYEGDGEGKLECKGSGCGYCPFGYYYEQHVDSDWDEVTIDYYCKPDSGVGGVEHVDGDWYRYNGDLQSMIDHDEANPLDSEGDPLPGDPVRVYFYDTGQLMDYSEAYERNLLMTCNKFVEVVSDTGDAKPWANRLSPDSEYTMHWDAIDIPTDTNQRLGISYNTTYLPYGAISDMDPAAYPYNWDAVPDTSENNPVNVGNQDYTSGGVTAGCTGDLCENIFGAGMTQDYGRLGVCSESNQNCLAYSVGADIALGRYSSMPSDSDSIDYDNYHGELRVDNIISLNSDKEGTAIVSLVNQDGSEIDDLVSNDEGGMIKIVGDSDHPFNFLESISDAGADYEVSFDLDSNASINVGDNWEIYEKVEGGTSGLGNGVNPNNLQPYRKFGLGEKYSCPENEYCIPLNSDTNSEMRAGLRSVYVKSYSSWRWDGGNYVSDTSAPEWTPPTTECSTDPRDPSDFCAIPPEVKNVQIDGNAGGDIVIHDNKIVDLTFNSDLDSQQVPITEIKIDWGDDNITSITHTKIREKNNADNPHSFNYLYNFQDLLDSYNNGVGSINCTDTDSNGSMDRCTVSDIRVIVKDNWDWCNNGTTINDCDTAGGEPFPGNIVVHRQ